MSSTHARHLVLDAPVIAGLQACAPDARCEACSTPVVFQPPPGKPLIDLAIRCAFCLRVFCRHCSIEHFR